MPTALESVTKIPTRDAIHIPDEDISARVFRTGEDSSSRMHVALSDKGSKEVRDNPQGVLAKALASYEALLEYGFELERNSSGFFAISEFDSPELLIQFNAHQTYQIDGHYVQVGFFAPSSPASWNL